jgi:hypothetical protein
MLLLIRCWHPGSVLSHVADGARMYGLDLLSSGERAVTVP